MQENEFQTWLAQHAPNALGRAITPQDGCAEERISAAQTRFGVAIPSSLRTLYQQLGECAMVMRSFQRFAPPEEWRMEGGRLMFLEENQLVCEWGVDAAGQVWMLVDDADAPWHPEALNLPDFLTALLPYQLAQGGWPLCGSTVVKRAEYPAELEAIAQELDWPLIVKHNGLTIYGKGSAMLWALDPLAEADSVRLYLNALREDEFEALTEQVGFVEL